MDISPDQTGIVLAGEHAAETAQDRCYLEAARQFGPALSRLARGYESSPERRQDLLQEIHVALWRSCAIFDGRCSLRTWVYRVAHITATRHVVASKRLRLGDMYSLDEVPELVAPHDEATTDREDSLQRLFALIVRLKPLDRQVILLYLENFSADAIGEVVGLTSVNIATRIHRIKKLLGSMINARGRS